MYADSGNIAVYGSGHNFGLYGYSSNGLGINGLGAINGVNGHESYIGVRVSADTGNTYDFYGDGPKSYFTGPVGIGNTAPSYTLDVAGDIRTTGAMRIPSGSVKPPIIYYVNVPLAAGSGSRVLVTKDINVTADMAGKPIWIDMGVEVMSATANVAMGLDGFTVLKNGVTFPLASDNGPYFARQGDYWNGSQYSWNIRNSYMFTPDTAGTYNISIKGYSAASANWYYLKMIIQEGTNAW